MKKIILITFIISRLAVLAQDDSIEIVRTPTQTEIGKPVGEKLREKFGKEGGRMVSADGRLELIIPQNAFSSKINISIQPTTNTLSPGSANAYELEPSGTHFQKPLQIIFHYAEKEAFGVMPELKGIAWQDDQGQWYRLENTVVDTTARTITGNIDHFSRWVWFDAFTLMPAAARVKVKKQLTLKIICTGLPAPSGTIMTDETVPQRMQFSTYADGVRGGNSVVGTTSGVSSNSIKYTAPASVPNRNPVAVSVETNAGFTLNGTTFNRLKLVSHVTVIDNTYEIKVVGHNRVEQRGVSGICVITGVDSSTCLLQLAGSNSKLQDIQNMNLKITINQCGCEVAEIAAGSSIGAVNILGAAKIDVVPANPPQKKYESVTIYFIRNFGVIAGMSAHCPGQAAISAPAFPIAAVPLVLKFEAKDEEQVILEGGDEKNGFKVTVKPVTGDE